MEILIDSGLFKRTVLSMLQSSQRINVNIRVVDGFLVLQGMSSITDERKLLVPVTVYDVMSISATVEFDRTLELLNEIRNTRLIINQNKESEHLGTVTIQQEGFSYTTGILPEDEFQVHSSITEDSISIFKSKLQRVAKLHTALDSVAKILSVTPASVQFYQGAAYVQYSNIGLRLSATGMLDAAFAGDVYRRGLSVMIEPEGGKVVVTDWENTRTELSIINKEQRILQQLVLPRQYLQVEALQSISNKMDTAQFVTKVDITDYESIMSTLGKSVFRQLIEVTVTKGGLRFLVLNPKASLQLGSTEEKLLSIRMSNAHIAAICAVFKGKGFINVEKGSDYLCLKSQDTTMIISGLLY